MSVRVEHYRFAVRGRTAAEWTALNEILLDREIGLETDTRNFKFGTGVTPWNSLEYAGGGGGGSAWHNGSGAPGGTLGAEGDYYLDVANGDVYEKEIGGWAVVGNIRGLQGPPGAQGIEGPRGGGIISDTKALLHFDGPNGSTVISDATGSRLWAVGGSDAKLSTVRSRFGTASLRLGASSRSHIQTAHAPELAMTSDFTVEAWVWRDSATRNTIASKIESASPAGSWYLAAMPDGVLRLVFGTGAFLTFDSAPGVVPVAAWAHVALVKQGSVARGFVNGVQVATGVLTGTITEGALYPLRVGFESPSATADRDFIGYIDEFRYSNAAKYTANFTPPPTPFSFPVGPQLPVFSIPNLPEVSGNAYVMIYVPNLAGGAEPCVSDGTNWRRLSDRSIAS